MTKLEKAILLDKILLKFEGNKTWTWDGIHTPEFYKDLNDDYFVIENHLNFLIGDGMLTKYRDVDYKDLTKNLEDYPELSNLTPKGFAVMTDLKNLGYEQKEKERERVDHREERTLFYAKKGFWIAFISAVLALIALFKCDAINFNVNF
jgi:hypothetical protein